MFNLKDTLSEISNLKTEEEIIDFVKNRINILENNSKIVFNLFAKTVGFKFGLCKGL